jgi:hypothetical protein
MTDDDLNAYGERLYQRWLRGDKEWMDFYSGEDWHAFTEAKARHDSVHRVDTEPEPESLASEADGPEDNLGK